MSGRFLAFTVVAIGALLSSCAGPGLGLTGNDTGGIIPAPAGLALARGMAAEHCAYYGKVARITSVRRQYGHYIGFSCRFDRRYTR
jgi:hypothetical protein